MPTNPPGQTETTHRPDLLIIGDSHTRALQIGCDEMGLRNKTLTLSGTAWFEADVCYSPKTGLTSKRRKWVGDAARKMAKPLGKTNPFKTGLPVLLSCMNLGRISSVHRWRGHRFVEDLANSDTPAAPDGELPLSRAMLADYSAHHLQRPLDLIRTLKENNADVIVVAPPSFAGLNQQIASTATFARLVRDIGVPCFNPWEHQPDAAVSLPAKHTHKDGRHGNDAYGRWVIETLLDNGALSLPKTAA